MVVFAAVAAIDTADDDEDSVRDAIGVGDRLGVACTQCREGVKLRNWIGLYREAEQDRLKILLPPMDIHGIFRTSFSCEFV